MTNVLSPMCAVAIYVVVHLGPDGAVTGSVFLTALLIAALTYVFCVAIDNLKERIEARSR